jgi:hypothetical protein
MQSAPAGEIIFFSIFFIFFIFFIVYDAAGSGWRDHF